MPVNLKRLYGTAGTLEHVVRAQDEVAWTCLPCSRFALIAGEGARGPSKELDSYAGEQCEP